ncbi:MAG: formate dehydrogenase accessory sulfurtransferase FdhD [Saprospirales bacterium]|nr:formate dehydrogenase accessory sulfurtransferase FdhD [Saprospirales bacterium]
MDKMNENKLISSLSAKPIWKMESGALSRHDDQLAVEEPLEIRIAFGQGPERHQESLSVTMRTPGSDQELAIGFLFTEGIISAANEVLSTRFVGTQWEDDMQYNSILVELAPTLAFDSQQLSRHFYTASSCGVCGKGSIELVKTHTCFFPIEHRPTIAASALRLFPERLRSAQPIFSCTGGIHAAGLFDPNGTLLSLREDVGRHNALDKLIGAALREGRIPLRDQALMVSGRASFELVQKALMAGIPILMAVGAPSSLAVELAQEYGMTLVGFLRENSFNVYTGENRILFDA